MDWIAPALSVLMLIGSGVAWLGARRERDSAAALNQARAVSEDAAADKLRHEAEAGAFGMLREAYNARLTLLEAHQGDMTKAMLEKSNRIAALEAERDTMRTRIAILEQQAAVINAEKVRLQNEYNATLRRLTEAHQSEMQSVRADHQREIAALQAEVDGLRAEVAALTSRQQKSPAG